MNYLNNLFSLKGKIAIVTGGARGNGKTISKALLNAGANVVMVDKLEKELNETINLFRSNELNAFKYVCDLTKKSAPAELVNFVIKKLDKIDILVNNAGVTHPNSIFDYNDKDWEETYEINLKAPFRLSREVAKHMKERISGVIINITSLNAELAFPNNPAYVSFKGALKQLTKSLALDLGEFGIRVNNIGPGYFKTNMTKKSWEDELKRKKITEKTVLGRWGEPDDLAGVVIFLASDASSYITGQDIYIDGGWLIKGL